MKSVLLAAAAAVLAPIAAQAATVAALTGDNTIVLVDTDSKKATKTFKVDGGRLVGIDVRPSDGLLYGLRADGSVVTIDTATGKATEKSKLDTKLADGVAGVVDFNPVADRLRVIGTDGTSLRANVDDGKVTTDKKLNFAEADASKGKTPKVTAGAYSFSVKGAKETVLYDIDAPTASLVRQAPPNDGVLNTIGALGVTVPADFGFDIVTDASGAHTGYLMAGATLHTVNLGSGKATEVTKITGVEGAIRDIAILPGA